MVNMSDNNLNTLKPESARVKNRTPSQQNRSSAWLILSVLLITTVFLLWNTWVRQQDYLQQEFNSVRNSVNGTSREIVTLLNEFRRAVKLLGERETSLLRKIAQDPNDIDAYDTLVEKVKNVFPKSFAVTLADANGEPFVEDFDGFIVEACKKDIKQFASAQHPPETYIHPNPLTYHFDIMVPVDLGFDKESIFFVSFKPDIISRLLATSQLFQHRLVLLKQDKPGLVEIVAEGVRKDLNENQFFLTEKEQNNISFMTPVEGTLWNLVSLPKETGISHHLLNIWVEVFIQFLLLVSLSIFIIKHLQRSEKNILETNIALSRHAHEIHKNEKRLERAQQIANMGHWDYNLVSEQLFLSDGANHILGITEDEATSAHQILHKIYPTDRQRIKRFIASAIVKRKPYQTEFRVFNHDGSISILSASVELTIDNDNNPLQLFGIVQDITARKQAEISNKNALIAKMDAETASETKSEFLANMSHEIRTPLTAIIGFAETLLQSDQPMKERTKSIRTIIRNGDHLLHIINDILDLSKIEAEKIEFEHVKFSPFHTLADVESLVRMQTTNKKLAFDIHYNFPLPAYINSDPLRLKQILLNICCNAIKFTHSGFIHINIGYDRDNEELWFEVADSGIGMDEPEIKKVFDTFTQADLSTTKEYGGTGLGLTISKYLAEQLGGTITVTSQPGVGSKFKVTIKTGELENIPFIDNLNQAPAEAATPATSIQANTLSGKILLAEDNNDNQRLLSMYLKKMGAEFTIVDNGKLAYEAAMNEEFDLILMDMQMPIMDGIEAVQLLRKANYNKPIAALTANAMKKDKDRCLAAGCDDFITKPIHRNVLYEVVSRYLRIIEPPEKSYPPIYSTLIKEEPDLIDIVNRFVDNLPTTLKLILNANEKQDWEELNNLAHQLKGVGGGYGYPMLTEIGSKIQFQLENKFYEEVTLLVNELGHVCQQICTGLATEKQSVA